MDMRGGEEGKRERGEEGKRGKGGEREGKTGRWEEGKSGKGGEGNGGRQGEGNRGRPGEGKSGIGKDTEREGGEDREMETSIEGRRVRRQVVSGCLLTLLSGSSIDRSFFRLLSCCAWLLEVWRPGWPRCEKLGGEVRVRGCRG